MNEKILLVDDEIAILHSLGGALRDEGYRVNFARSGEEALKEVQGDMPDVMLLDIWMPGMDGLAVLEQVRQQALQMPVIVISGHGNIETAVRATKLGAFDFVEKPLSLDRILVSIQNALEVQRLQEDNRIWRQKATRRFQISGRSPVIASLSSQIERAAPSNATVLITGENGTGKELVAKAIHHLSLRNQRPLIEVNCAAIPEELIESELFGHEKGAFTGALEKRRGKFDLANGGTLFLDEIADMSLRTQAKILRIIQEQTFERVGGSRTVQVDVRIIAATNKDLQGEIETGRFRQDLYYRLNVIPLHVPPLRERLEDIPILVEDFLNDFASESALGRKQVAREVLQSLQHYEWPGNVRELKNFIERLVIMTPGNSIATKDLPEDFLGHLQVPFATDNPYQVPTLREARHCFERVYLLRKLEENDWNVSVTASRIGVERTHLHRKMKLLEIRGNTESPSVHDIGSDSQGGS
jgi:two-component system, NtrC family, nitrogen regulation response regulator NtrX